MQCFGMRCWGLLAAVVGLVRAELLVTTGRVDVAIPTVEHRIYEQRWVVNQHGYQHVQKIHLSIPGRVFISHAYDFGPDPPDAPVGHVGSPVAHIRISGNEEDLLQFFEVVATGSDTIEIRQRSDFQGVLTDAYMLTEISLVRSHAIHTVITHGSGDVVVEDQVLVSDPVVADKLELQKKGSGTLFVKTSTPVRVNQAVIKMEGRGDLFWSMSELVTTALNLSTSGAGDVVIQTPRLLATTLSASTKGAGDVCVQASDLVATTIIPSIFGAGDISIKSNRGRATHEQITLTGSGDVMLGEVLAEDVTVRAVGPGDVTVQATESISGTRIGGGSVHYVGSFVPKRVSDRSNSHVFSTSDKSSYKPIAKSGHLNFDFPCKVEAIPPRQTGKVELLVRMNWTWTMPLPPLLFLAFLSLCYLRGEMKRRRQPTRRNLVRFHSMPAPSNLEMRPLIPQQSMPLQPRQHPPQQQPQYQSTQVYV
ncbi:hypothetical protein Poli38472_010820 [Pythium oligandrum]|uniref:Putative auto-transporter adhesin head GIN domain-containing protein n=1 Tax=Pythium oligandrum TaxID=41045 RepID=A0A8K1FJF7_PYTOL|nr:hypothetical protein Poli38472_010820 [Pythium oligandrum]|eukprot:TMW61757.1 hypothetical protein Poli38472_010820 [Pythium oligandrum]